MKKLGIIGYRGMVGSVLMARMASEKDFSRFTTSLFSTSQAGQTTSTKNVESTILNAKSIEELSTQDILISCQGGDYTKEIYPKLREAGWSGYWIDAASAKRMDDDSLIVLDPINQKEIKSALDNGVKNFIGGNCTVSLMLLATKALFENDWVEWVTSQTYQAASGAGAAAMKELIDQMDQVGRYAALNENLAILDLEKNLNFFAASPEFKTQNFGAALAMNVLPWIDTKVENGQSREEWKAQVEANKILNTNSIIPIDGTCVRVGALRCHAQALAIKLKKNIPLADIELAIKESHPWIRFVENEKEATLKNLTPTSVSGTLEIAVGRLRKMNLGEEYLNMFTLGDQLLWGAAEPLRRMLQYLG